MVLQHNKSRMLHEIIDKKVMFSHFVSVITPQRLLARLSTVECPCNVLQNELYVWLKEIR
jgi:hypothetical protein